MLSAGRLSVSLTLLSFFSLVKGHGFITVAKCDGIDHETCNPWSDPGLTKETITRNFNSGDPLKVYDDGQIACKGNGANTNQPAAKVADVTAGSTISMKWTNGPNSPWPVSHKGPIASYLADCQGDCTTFDAKSGNIWFKIQEEGYRGLIPGGIPDGGTSGGRLYTAWASDDLINDKPSTATIPKNLRPGQYLLRHEHIALHGAHGGPGNAEVYVSCMQLNVKGDGDAFPPADALVAFPGAYDKMDPGMNYAPGIWGQQERTYVVPGPRPWNGEGSGSSGNSTTPTPVQAVQEDAAAADETPEVETPSPNAPAGGDEYGESPAIPESPSTNEPIVAEEEEPVFASGQPAEMPASSQPASQPAAPQPATPQPAAPQQPAPAPAPASGSSPMNYNECMCAMNDCKNKANANGGVGFDACGDGSNCHMRFKRGHGQNKQRLH